MFSRRYLRIKVVHAIYAHQQETTYDLDETVDYLKKSMDATYHLYVFLNKMLSEVIDYSAADLELVSQKMNPSEEDALASDVWMSFDYSRALHEFDFKKYFRKHKIQIDIDEDISKMVYKAFKADPEYADLKSKGFENAKDQVYALQYLLADIMMNHEAFDNFMEEHWINWQDEKEFAMNAVLKTIKACKSPEKSPIFAAKYKGSEDDQTFIDELLKDTIYDTHQTLNVIGEHAQNWDVDRITLLDKVILQTAISEMYGSEVPLRVTLDEYIEISKIYSTPKSKDFINGVLDKVMKTIAKSGTKA